MIIEKPYLTNYVTHVSYENYFTEEECEFISALAWKWQDGLVQGAEQRENEVRDSDIFWLSFRNDIAWIWEKLKYKIEEANSYHWQMNLENFHEHIQLTRYTKSGHYDWHVDHGNHRTSYRKLSCVLNLTDENKFKDGGTLIKVSNKAELLSKKQGTLHIFPSYTLHKAKKVKSGTRLSLVCWVGGEPFK